MRINSKKLDLLINSNLILIIFILVSLTPFFKITFGLLSLSGYDFYHKFFFSRYFLKNALLTNGTLPLWFPYVFTGVPLIANPQNGVFYPFTYLFFIIPWENLYGFFVILHLILGNLFMFIFLRKGIGLSPFSSIIGCMTFVLYEDLWYRIFLGWLPFIQSYIWIPLIVYYYLRSIEQKKYLIHTAFLFTIQFLGGDPQTSYETNLFLCLLTLYKIGADFNNRGFDGAKNTLKIYLLTIIFFFLLSMIQFLPAAEFTKYSWRTEGIGYNIITLRSSPVLMSLISPLLLSIIPLLVIFLSGKKILKREAIYFLLALFFLLLALGGNTPVYKLFYYILPGLKFFRDPDLFFMIFNFIIAYLFSISFEKLKGANISTFKFLYLIVIFQFAILLIHPFKFIEKFNFSEKLTKYQKVIFQATASENQIERVVIFPDLMSANPGIPADSAIIINRENIFGYDPLTPSIFVEIFREAPRVPVVGIMKAFGARFIFTKNIINNENFSLIYNDEFYIYKLEEEVKRFYIARIPVSDENVSLTRFLQDKNFEKEGKVIVDKIVQSEFKNGVISAQEINDRIELIDYRPDSITLRVNLTAPGILVLKNHYHPGWRARIDGQSAPVFKTNYLFQGILLTQGIHTVHLKFMPLSFQIGSIVSIITLVILGFLYFRFNKKKVVSIRKNPNPF